MKKSTPENPTKNLLEWIVFGICSVLVLLTLGYLVTAALTVEEGPARLVVKTGTPVSENGWLRVPVTVTNEGNRVAANVEVQITLGSGDEKQDAGFTVDYVPRGAERSGAVSFKDATPPAEIEGQVVGYEEP